MSTPTQKFPKASLFGGTVCFLFGLTLFESARHAASTGGVVRTEYDAGWLPPSLAYAISGFFLLVAAYLFIGYFVERRLRR
jgi:hypothetical protein